MKIPVVLLSFMLVAVLIAGQTTPATGTGKEKKAAAAETKEAQWEGHIVRVNKDKSNLSIRGGPKASDRTERQIVYDTSTQWTKQGKPAEQTEFKEGSYVIAVGHPDKKGVFHATRIDLRLPR